MKLSSLPIDFSDRLYGVNGFLFLLFLLLMRSPHSLDSF